MALNSYFVHFSRNNKKVIISALDDEDGRCMGVHSMGAPLMSQIWLVFRLRLQTANDYLALGGLVIHQPMHIVKK